MSTGMTATFATRREAELVIERLVQEFGIARDAIEVHAEGAKNSAGEAASGGDRKAAEPSVEARTDVPLEGRIIVSVKPGPSADTDAVRAAFNEFGGDLR